MYKLFPAGSGFTLPSFAHLHFSLAFVTNLKLWCMLRHLSSICFNWFTFPGEVFLWKSRKLSPHYAVQRRPSSALPPWSVCSLFLQPPEVSFLSSWHHAKRGKTGTSKLNLNWMRKIKELKVKVTIYNDVERPEIAAHWQTLKTSTWLSIFRRNERIQHLEIQ